ncbi:MAG: N-acetylmannosamine-6-phosphate 2-epimerase [Candidatus Obscuribacterales bacterium]
MVSEKVYDKVKALQGGLIVSCQASTGEPLCKPDHIVALCLTVINGGADALRLEGVDNIRAVRAVTELPIIGITKTDGLTAEERLEKVFITPTFEDARRVAEAGADIIALDATARPRPDGLSLEETIALVHRELDKPVWADVATLEEGTAAFAAGSDIVSTTLFGYTSYCLADETDGPSFDLLRGLVEAVTVPVILEGRVWHTEDVERAIEAGAYAVVVGSAITRPHLITRRFRQALTAKSLHK